MSQVRVFNPNDYSNQSTPSPILSAGLEIGEIWAMQRFAEMTDCVLHQWLDEGIIFASLEYENLLLVIGPRASMFSQNPVAVMNKVQAYSKKPLKFGYIDCYQFFKKPLVAAETCQFLKFQEWGIGQQKGEVYLPVTKGYPNPRLL